MVETAATSSSLPRYFGIQLTLEVGGENYYFVVSGQFSCPDYVVKIDLRSFVVENSS